MNVQLLTDKIAKQYDGLSPVLRRIADFVLENSEDIVIMTIQDIADTADVKPSALIRFAKALGFDGFKSMQKVFAEEYRKNRSVYADRVSKLKQNMVSGNADILQRTVIQAVQQVDTILDNVQQQQLDAIATTIADAKTVYLYARGRSEAVGVSMRYALLGLGYTSIILPDEDNLAIGYLNNADRNDCIVAVSFKSYWGPVEALLGIAREKGMPSVGITDMVTSPLYQGADTCICIKDDIHAFPRTLSGTIVLVEAILKTIALRGTDI